MKKYVTSILVLFLLVPVLNTSEEKKEFILDEVLELGLNNNPVLLAKAQEVEAKKSAFQASKLLSNPELSYQTGKGELYDTPGKINTDSVSLSQYLENPFKRHYRVQMFEKEWQASEHFFHFSKIEITYEIKRLFFPKKPEFSRRNLPVDFKKSRTGRDTGAGSDQTPCRNPQSPERIEQDPDRTEVSQGKPE
jgi:hypothetical protein